MAENKQTLHPSRMCISNNNNKNIRNLYAKAEKRAAFFSKLYSFRHNFYFLATHHWRVFLPFCENIEEEIGIHTISE